MFTLRFSNNLPSQYWQLVNVGLGHDEAFDYRSTFTYPYSNQKHIAKFLAQPTTYQNSIADLADILTICISQEDDLSQHIRQQLNIGDELLMILNFKF